MKHVHESLSQFYDYKFFKMLEEDTSDKKDLQQKEKDGLAVIEKIKKNFEDFKKEAGDEILKYKEFWEENKKTKEAFSETGEVYKMFDTDYVIGVLELPVETLSDGSIDGGFGATDEPEEEIIEGPEIDTTEVAEETPEEGQETDFFEEQTVPQKTNESLNEAEEDEEIDIDLSQPDTEEEPLDDISPDDAALGDLSKEAPSDQPAEETPAEEPLDMPAEEPMTSEQPNLNEPQKYFVVYDITGDEREEILRCGSNNVVNAFTSFYNDTFKGAMKNIILQYKEQKAKEKAEAEKAEKAKVEKKKESKIEKFLKESVNEYEYDDDELADYEYEVSSLISAQFEDNDIYYDKDMLIDTIREHVPFVLQCMKDDMEPMDCAVELLSNEDFLEDMGISENDF